MLKAILIDDERNALELLQHQLAHYCTEVEVVALAQGGAAGVEAIKAHQPDLVFLDIEMPTLSGFDVLEQTRGYSYEVIFITAYDQFAVKAFRFAALDYLLKPIEIDDLIGAVAKVVKWRKEPFAQQLEQALQHVLPDKARIALPTNDGFQMTEVSEITHCSSDSNYTHVFLTNNCKITLAKTLKDVEESLAGLSFYRVHHSHLINLNHVQRLSRQDGGYVILSSGVQISISRSRRDGFLELIRKL